jgi:hypothetical protein
VLVGGERLDRIVGAVDDHREGPWWSWNSWNEGQLRRGNAVPIYRGAVRGIPGIGWAEDRTDRHEPVAPRNGQAERLNAAGLRPRPRRGRLTARSSRGSAPIAGHGRDDDTTRVDPGVARCAGLASFGHSPASISTPPLPVGHVRIEHLHELRRRLAEHTDQGSINDRVTTRLVASVRGQHPCTATRATGCPRGRGPPSGSTTLDSGYRTPAGGSLRHRPHPRPSRGVFS